MGVQVLSGLIEVFSCSLVAYGIARFRFKGRNLIFFLAIAMIMIPPQMTAVPMSLNFAHFDVFGILGLIGNIIGKDIRPNLLDTGFTFWLPSLFGVGLRSGLFVFIYRQFFKVLPKELEEAAGREEAQYETMKSRIQYMYECGTGTYFETLLQADSFADLLNRAEYVEELTAYDNRILEAYALQKEYLALCKESLELEKITLDESKAALEEEKKGLAAIRQQKAEDLAAFEDDISITQAQLKELEADLKYQTNLIASLEKEITDEQKKILAENNMQLGYNSDGFAWPAPNCKVVTSEFGWRSDPFTGLKAYHNGVDLSGSKVEGTPIVAAYDGIVGQASYNSSMGNYIYLEHGDGLRTIYLHASKLYVSKNDVVKKGDVIAAVGSTGRSTGAHLHFSVRLNGEYVSPWNYMSR
jgi:murein DD-endopeptidase MepM/ murein hydrolase activator NlpD